MVVATDSVGTQFNGLTVSTTGVTANQSKVLVNSLGEVSDQYAAGDFTGIRSFALRFTTVPTSTTNVFLQNSQSGQ